MGESLLTTLLLCVSASKPSLVSHGIPSYSVCMLSMNIESMMKNISLINFVLPVYLRSYSRLC